MEKRMWTGTEIPGQLPLFPDPEPAHPLDTPYEPKVPVLWCTDPECPEYGVTPEGECYPYDRCDPPNGHHSTPHRGCILR